MRGAIHTLTVYNVAPDDPDSEGRGAASMAAQSAISGRIAELSAQERSLGGSYAEDATAAALVPLATTVSVGDEVVAAGAGDELNGTWTVAAVRDLVPHRRVMLRRTER